MTNDYQINSTLFEEEKCVLFLPSQNDGDEREITSSGISAMEKRTFFSHFLKKEIKSQR
eukprot:GDKH01015533.1.p1 GENE.GDKH01015533.1~~GDKH01015533.1.p1  ORF type:complete len:59 (+),score=6.36 GDKH01015533.1:47-223(+)